MCKHTEHSIAARWEAGEAACAQLIIGLKRALAGLEPGQLLEMVSDDDGAKVDVPAWCRITGHELLSSNHPSYIIRN